MKKFKWNIVAVIVLMGVLIGGAIVFAEDEGEMNDDGQKIAGIIFPIVELGDCTSKKECRAYCDSAVHMEECVLFAESHGLINKDEANRAKKFTKEVRARTGPGKCDSPQGCRAYCEDITHIDECVAFAEKHDFGGEEYKQGKKLNQFLKGGGTMPGGCTSRVSCEAYCSNFSHAEECYVFAEKSGIAGDDDDSVDKDLQDEGMGRPGVHREGGMPSREQMKKLVELVTKGETPGKCQSKNECESYCRVEEHMDECTTFAEKMGFMGKEDVERAKRFRSQGGPGGCKTQEECDKFCNTLENRGICFAFAEENNLISKEELARMKDGMVRMRAGLDNAPKEVRECLKSSLGETIITDIQSGTMVPGPEIGERMRGCFEKFGENHDMRRTFTHAPPEILACLKEKLGDQYADLHSGKIKPTPEIADTFRMCFQQMEMTQGKWGEHGDDQGNKREGQETGPTPEKIRGYIQSAPPEVAICLKEKLGDAFDRLQMGEAPLTPEFGEKMRGCFESFRPHTEGRTDEHNPRMMGRPGMDDQDTLLSGGGQEGNMDATRDSNRRKDEGGSTHGEPSKGGMLPRMSASMQDCVKGKIGDDVFAKLGNMQLPSEIYEAVKGCMVQDGMQNHGKPRGGMMMREPKDGEHPEGEGQKPYPHPEYPEQGNMPPRGSVPPEHLYPSSNNPMRENFPVPHPQGGMPGGEMMPAPQGDGPGGQPPPSLGMPPSQPQASKTQFLLGATAAAFIHFRR